jgi:hypothetical protein
MPGCKIWNRWYCLKQSKLSGHEIFYWPLLSTYQQPTGSNVPHEDKFQTLTPIKLVGKFLSVSGGKIVHPTYARPPPSFISASSSTSDFLLSSVVVSDKNCLDHVPPWLSASRQDATRKWSSWNEETSPPLHWINMHCLSYMWGPHVMRETRRQQNE